MTETARSLAHEQDTGTPTGRSAADGTTREPGIDETTVGNMGSFYRVRIGPFASAQEGQAACAKLKGPGIDCRVVGQ